MSKTKIVGPAFLIGLGDLGKGSVLAIREYIAKGNPVLSRVMRGVYFEDNGVIRSIDDEWKLLGQLELPDHSRDKSPYESTRQSFLRAEDLVTGILSKGIEQLRSSEVLELQELGVEVKKDIQIYCFTSSFDLLASTITIPLLGIINSMISNGQLSGKYQTSLFVNLPDLSPTNEVETQKQENARSFQFFNELDFELKQSQDFPAEADCDLKMIWLCSNQNEIQLTVGDMTIINMLLCRVIESFLVFRVLGDFSFLEQAKRRRMQGGKKALYSSFGLSRLVYPEADFFSYLSIYGSYKLIGGLTHELDEHKFDRSLIFGSCWQFLESNNLVSLSKLLSRSAEGQDIFTLFSIPLPKTTDILPSTFSEELINKYTIYEQSDFSLYVNQLSQRADSLLARIHESLTSYLRKELDTDGRGPAFVSALLASLQSFDSVYLSGDPLDTKHSVAEIEIPVRKFYKGDLEIDTKEEQIIRIEEDLKSMDRRLADSQQQVLKLQVNSAKVPNEVDLEKIKSEVDRQEQKVKALQSERKALEKSFNSLKSEIESLNQQIESAEKRRELKDKAVEKQRASIDEEVRQLESVHTKVLEETSRLFDLVELRKMLYWRFTVVIPSLVLTVLTILGGVLVYTRTVSTPEYLYHFLTHPGLYCSILAAYGLAAYLYFELKCGKKYRESKQQLSDVQAQKSSAMVRLTKSFGELSRVQSVHEIHNQALQFCKRFRDILSLKYSEVEAMIKYLRNAYEVLTVERGGAKIPSTFMYKSIFQKADIERIYEESPLTLGGFYKHRPLSTYLFPTLNVRPDLLVDLGSYVKEGFIDYQKYSLEDLIFMNSREDELVSPDLIRQKLEALFSAASPLVSLQQLGDQEKPEQIVKICIENGDESRIPKIFDASFNLKKSDHCSTGEKNFIEIDRFKICYPLYHVSKVRYMKECNEKLANSSGIEFSIDRARYADYSIFPADVDELDRNVEIVHTVYPAIWLGVLDRDSQKYIFEGKMIGSDISEVCKFLRSFRGKQVKHRISSLLSDLRIRKPEEYSDRLRLVLDPKSSHAYTSEELEVARLLLAEEHPLA